MSRSTAGCLTKLRPPNYSFKPVSTLAIKALMEGGALPKIVAVAAPPGYGKTVLMTQHFQRLTENGSRCLWIGLDDRDAGVAALLGLLEDALEVEQTPPPLPLDYNWASSTAARVNRIIASLASSQDRVTVFIDNIDICLGDDVESVLNALVFDTPDTVSLVISSSSSVPFDAVRAMLELRLRMIGPAELGFDASNIELLFREAGSRSLSPGMAAAIFEQTEGWPAAVRLMQVISTTDPTIVDLAGHTSRGGVQLAEILSRRLMSRFNPALAVFLCDIAEFKQFTVDMVTAATGTSDAHRFVRYLIDNNVLIMPLDERQSWFRFHTLFREFLIDYAKGRLAPERRHAILTRAAQWLEERDHTLQGLELAIRAGDLPMVTRMLEKLAWDLVRNHGDLPSFIVWVEQARTIGAPLGVEASFWHVWALIFDRKYELAKGALGSLAALIQASNFPCSHARNLQAKAGLAEMVLKLHLDELRAIQERAPAWLDTYAEADSFEVGAVAGAMALAFLADHQFATARRALRLSQSAVVGTASLYGRAWVANITAAAEIASGNVGQLDGPLLEIQRRLDAEVSDDTVIAAVTSQVRARAFFACGDVETAKGIVEKSLMQMQGNGILDFTWMGIETILPHVLRAETFITLSDLRGIAREYPRRLSLLLELSIIRLLVYQGRAEDAAGRAVDLGIWVPAGVFTRPDDGTLAMERSAANMAGIALLTAFGHFRKAEELIQEELLKALEIGRRSAEVELYLAQTGIFVKSGRWREALRAFSKAINVAADRRLLQPFLEQGNLVAHMMANSKLKELGVATVAENNLVGDISRLLGCERPATMGGGPAETFGSPTARELELLSMIERGLDNLQMAEALSLSVRTVKWHLSNLYAKLDVKNRTGALAKARNLRLL